MSRIRCLERRLLHDAMIPVNAVAGKKHLK